MKHPQVIVWERDGRLGQLLREAVQARRWVLREPRQLGPCLTLLREGHPTVMVVKVSSKVESELELLEQTHDLPQTRTVIVGDVENDPLANLAWDLGASFVLFPPLPHDWLAEIVVHLMEEGIALSRPV